MVINDDEWSESTHQAATKTNGHLLHAIKDQRGEPRQALYTQ